MILGHCVGKSLLVCLDMVFEGETVDGEASFHRQPLQALPVAFMLRSSGLNHGAGRLYDTVRVFRGARASKLVDRAAL